MKTPLRILLHLCAAILLTALMASAMSPEARRSLDAMTRRAESGDPEAMYRLANLYERGYDSIAPDTARARDLLVRSADAGYAPAMNYLGFLLIDNSDSSSTPSDDLRRGFSLLREACRKGDPKAASNLAFLILNDSTGRFTTLVENPDSTAAAYLTAAADQGLPAACSLLADLYREGRILPADTLRAAELYETAASAGLADAEIRLINMSGPSWNRLPPEDALELGREYFSTFAPRAGTVLLDVAAKDPGITGAHAKFLLSEAYATARGVDYDYYRSLELLRDSALAGYEPARKRLLEVLEMFPDTFPDIDPDSLR